MQIRRIAIADIRFPEITYMYFPVDIAVAERVIYNGNETEAPRFVSEGLLAPTVGRATNSRQKISIVIKASTSAKHAETHGCGNTATVSQPFRDYSVASKRNRRAAGRPTG
jgi:hypothetical protein